MVPFGDAALHRRLQENVDWGAPIGGQTTVSYDDRDIPAFKRRANIGPVIFPA
jgi:hypothetical protein